MAAAASDPAADTLNQETDQASLQGRLACFRALESFSHERQTARQHA